MSEPAVSIVIPILDEREALGALVAETEQACSGIPGGWEAILVDDGSTDGSWGEINELANRCERIRGVRLRRNFGKSAALAAGISAARGDAVVTMDGDGQDDPAEIPALLAALDEGSDLVCGWKVERKDSARRRWASRLFNAASSRLTGVRIHDANCGLKAMRADCARSLDLFGELHRFIPALAAQQGWRVDEVPVRHRPRRHGTSRFGRERFARGLLDLLAVVFLGRYANRPLHLFGGIGLVLGLAGVAVCGYLTIEKLNGASIGDRPLLFLGILLIVIGVQIAGLGLLGQMIAVSGQPSGERAVLVAETAGRDSEEDRG